MKKDKAEKGKAPEVVYTTMELYNYNQNLTDKYKEIPTRLLNRSQKQDIINNILTAITNGKSMNIALETNKIWRNTFFNWIDEDELLQQAYTRARQRLGHALYDRILDEVNEIDSVESAMIAKAKIDPLKWLAGKANQQYNDKYTGEQNAPILIDAGALSQEEREANIGKLVEKLTLLKQSYQRQNRKLNSGNSDTNNNQ